MKPILKDLDLQIASQQLQKQSYLGNHADLLKYMKEKNKKSMTTAAVRTWLTKNGSFPSAYVKRGITLEDCDIDPYTATVCGRRRSPIQLLHLAEETEQALEWLVEQHTS